MGTGGSTLGDLGAQTARTSRRDGRKREFAASALGAETSSKANVSDCDGVERAALRDKTRALCGKLAGFAGVRRGRAGAEDANTLGEGASFSIAGRAISVARKRAATQAVKRGQRRGIATAEMLMTADREATSGNLRKLIDGTQAANRQEPGRLCVGRCARRA